jgi:hypothetical protein
MIQHGCRQKQLQFAKSGSGFFAQSGKVLNLCADSKRRTTVIFRAIAQNKFIKYLRWYGAEANFPTTLPHYADK